MFGGMGRGRQNEKDNGVPLVLAVIIFQKRIVAGMTAGAVKG